MKPLAVISGISTGLAVSSIIACLVFISQERQTETEVTLLIAMCSISASIFVFCLTVNAPGYSLLWSALVLPGTFGAYALLQWTQPDSRLNGGYFVLGVLWLCFTTFEIVRLAREWFNRTEAQYDE